MRFSFAAVMAIALALWAGCGYVTPKAGSNGADEVMANAPHYDAFSNSAAPPPPPSATDSGGPRVITDLSVVSNATTVGALNGSQHEAFVQTQRAGAPQAAVTQYNIDRFYLAHPAIEMDEEENAKLAGDVTLLNQKAARFPEFSYQMLNRTLPIAQKLAAAKLDGRQLPAGIKPIILTATLSPNGKLVDISIEQHSGVAAVDHIMIDACKSGLWGMNPPSEAAAPDQSYRVHFEGAIYNYSFDRYGEYSYITHVGVGLL
jgi:hypothetical protein